MPVTTSAKRSSDESENDAEVVLSVMVTSLIVERKYKAPMVDGVPVAIRDDPTTLIDSAVLEPAVSSLVAAAHVLPPVHAIETCELPPKEMASLETEVIDDAVSIEMPTVVASARITNVEESNTNPFARVMVPLTSAPSMGTDVVEIVFAPSRETRKLLIIPGVVIKNAATLLVELIDRAESVMSW